MVDPKAAIEILGPSALALKMLGPTADYLGGGIRTWSEMRVENVRRILLKAEQKVASDTLDDAGAVAPRVLRGVLDDGSFVADELSQDYFGGVLASSHSQGGRDDRAATYTELLSRLSTYQVRTHYILYSAAQEVCAALDDIDLSHVAGRERVGDFFVPFPRFFASLDLSDDEFDDVSSILTHSLVGLHREGLIDVHWHFATERENVNASEAGKGHEFPSGGLIFGISMFGIELYCAAHGLAGEPAALFILPRETFLPRMSTAVKPVNAERISDFPLQVKTPTEVVENAS